VYHKYTDEEEIVDITPIAMNRYDDLEVVEVDSFNEELDDFFSTQEEEPEFTEDKTETTGKLTKFQKILNNQQTHLKSLIDQEEKEKKKGDLLYANFADIDELLTTILKTRRNGVSWKEIEEKLVIGKEKGIASAMLFEEIKPKNKLIDLKFSDEKGEEVKIELDFTLPLVESANRFYEKSKKARRKIPGAEAAISRTKKQIEETSTKKEEIEKEIETKPLVIKRTKRWYEKFHWFICKDHVVIGGTDAKTNERILKTYLDDNDLFFHADVHGAPYVVVKEGQTNLSEECINEIASFALNYSSLWKEKKLVGDVYSVLPDQVSLTAPSGQYLSKGSVMIYGTKNYQKNVEINHSVGIVIFDEYAQVIGGPLKSVEERTSINIQIKPGDVPKGKLAKEIREILFKKCPEDEKHKVESLTVNEFLPFIPGDSKILK
jgi:predicted ribosome quality control (RQC) complex YloA/Tae2 family protein